MVSRKDSLDELLQKFKLHQRYHAQLMLWIIVGYITNGMYYANYIFAFEEVKYRCSTQNTSQMYCTLQPNETCTEWIYDKPESFVAEFNLACQDWKRTTIGTIHGLGYMFGILLIGPISDRVGRKTAVVITGTIGGVLGILRSFSNGFIIYSIMEFLEAAIGDLTSPLYVLGVEFVSAEKRSSFVSFSTIGFSLGRMLFALIAWLIPHIRIFLRVIYIPALFFILYSFLVDESPRWLLNKGRKNAAIAVLEKIAKSNKTKLENNALQNLTCESEENESRNKGLLLTLQSRLLRNRFFICIIWWTTATFVSFGMRINSVSLAGNKYLNYILLAFCEIPVILFSIYILKRFKRKKPFIFCFFSAAAFCMALPFIPSDLPWLSVLVFMIGNVLTSFYFTITYLYTSEMFPTYSRNSMQALCSSLGRIGSLLAPQTPLLIQYWSGLPAFIFGMVSLIAGLITFFMPDVGDDSLPDTVRQAEAVGKSNDLEKNCNEGTFDKLL